MGQAPRGDTYNDTGIGFPLIAGAGDYGELFPEPKKYTTAPTKLSRVSDIILCIRATIGDLNWSDKVYCLGRGVAALQPIEEKLDSKFLWYFIIANKEQLSKNATGSTFKQINRKILEEFEIPLPSIELQKHIAEILEKADNVQKQCQQVEQNLNTLAQSLFLEMFGEPEQNPKGWKRCFYKDLGKVQTGNTPPRSENASYGEYIEWIKSDNIREKNIYLSKSKEWLSERGMKLGRVAPKGSVLVTCIAGSSKTIGNAAIANRDVAFNQQINSITPYEDVEPIFLYGLCRAMKRVVQNSTTSGMKRIITKSNFEKIPVFKPPLAEQVKFTKAFILIDNLSAQQKKRTLDADSLFRTLLEKAFNGDLRLKSIEKMNKLEAQKGHV